MTYVIIKANTPRKLDEGVSQTLLCPGGLQLRGGDGGVETALWHRFDEAPELGASWCGLLSRKEVSQADPEGDKAGRLLKASRGRSSH